MISGIFHTFSSGIPQVTIRFHDTLLLPIYYLSTTLSGWDFPSASHWHPIVIESEPNRVILKIQFEYQ